MCEPVALSLCKTVSKSNLGRRRFRPWASRSRWLEQGPKAWPEWSVEHRDRRRRMIVAFAQQFAMAVPDLGLVPERFGIQLRPLVRRAFEVRICIGTPAGSLHA
jgi:hypothetical protein